MIMANSTNGTTSNVNNNTTADSQLSTSSSSPSQVNSPSSPTNATSNPNSNVATANQSNKVPQATSGTNQSKQVTATTNDTNDDTSSSIISNGNNNTTMSGCNDNRWIFPIEKIINSPSRLDNISLDDELKERQEAALFITDLGASLKVNQLCINTAIIYMHRFYMIHSFKKFHRYVRMIATSCLFFACKVEEQPRRLREFIDTIHRILHKTNEALNPQSEEYQKCANEITALESCLLQTLGFNVLINHAHTVIIKTCQMIKAPRDLAEAAYLTATNSLVLTNFCIKFSPEKVACFCIYLACKWTGIKIPTSSEGLQWYQYVKDDIVEQELEDISKEYLSIYDKCSPKIQKKLGKTKHVDEGKQLQAVQVQKSQKPNQISHPQQQQIKKLPDNKPTGVQQQQNVNISHKQQPASTLSQPHSQHHPSKPSQNGSGGPQHHFNPHQHKLQHQPRPQNVPNPINKQQQSTSKDPNQIKQQYFNNKSTSIPPSTSASSLSNTNILTSSNPNKSNGSIQTGATSQSKPLNQTASLSNLSAVNELANDSINNTKPSQSLSSSTLNKKLPSQQQSSSVSPTPSQITSTSSVKRVNEDLNNIQSVPNKIPKYVIDQKSVNI